MASNKFEKGKQNAKLLQLIAERNTSEIIGEDIRLAIRSGPDIDFQDQNLDGYTPLHVAVERRDLKAIKFFIELHANISIKNNNYETAVDIANKQGNVEITQALQPHTRKINPRFIIELNSSNLVIEENKLKSPDFKILKLTVNAKSNITESLTCEQLKKLTNESTHLFVIAVLLSESSVNPISVEKIEKCLCPHRPWIIQVENQSGFSLYVKYPSKYQNSSLNLISFEENVTEIDFNVKILRDCNFQELIQGFFSNLIGKVEKNVLDAKWYKNDLGSKTLKIVTKKDALCLRFLKLFDIQFPEWSHASSAQGRGVDKPFALLDVPFEPSTNENHIRNDQIQTILQKNSVNDYPILINAIETDNVEIIRFLLKLGFDLSDQMRLSNVAWEQKSFKCLKELLRLDMPYPEKFNQKRLSRGFKKFIDELETFHEQIEKNDETRVQEFINKHPRIKCAYSQTNTSALTVALEAKLCGMYSFLLKNGFQSGVDNKTINALGQLSEEQKALIKQANDELHEPTKDSHLIFLKSKIKVAFKPEYPEKKLEIIHKMFDELDKILEIHPILKALANCPKFELNVDFTKPGVDKMIPKESERTQGICYHYMGKIYLGARTAVTMGSMKQWEF